ncbi:MAG: peroxiredoxin family protein [Planctomycetes bacterium]|nr:peroxiredoxin family protein [Planctomycetota bacterium]
MTASLFALTLAIAAPPLTGLQRGDEFTFTGTVAEEVKRPPNFFRRNHEIELRVFVLDRQDNWADAAVLTRLQRMEDAVGGAVGAVTGRPAKDFPPSVRLDLVRLYTDGTVHLLAPVGLPLKLTADTPARGLPPIPLDAFAASEFGIFPPVIPRDNAGEVWTITPANRPIERWQAKGFEFLNAERCRKIIGNQMSADWEKPVGGQTSWLREDAVWVSTQDGTARKVHRVIKQRDGRADQPAAWVDVKYELKDQARLNGQTFDRLRRDVEVAYAALGDAAQLVPDALKLGPKTFENRIAKLDGLIDETVQTSPYREAMQAARRMLDDARNGKTSAIQPTAVGPVISMSRSVEPSLGQVAPDFTAGQFRLAEQQGKPVALVFFRPGGETTDLSLAIAAALEKRYAGRLVVAPCAVFGDVAGGVKARDKLKLTIPIFDGTKAVTAYGIETAPRFFLIDGAGKLRWSFTGVGAETGFLLKEQADLLVAPASPNVTTGIVNGGAPALPPIVPRP